MYRVIIVDDEPWALLGIKKTFKWDFFGFEITNETTDSEEAIELILKEKPDVVFTDISMPELSGIDIIRIARGKGLKTIFVIISGYADFKFAQEAIKYGAFEYCLKPIMQEEADRILKNVKNACDRENGIYDIEYNEIDISSLSFKKVISYIHKNYKNKLQLNEIAEMFDLHPNYCCSLFKKHFDCNFTSYVVGVRMKEAEKLLIQGEMSLQEIASSVGCNDYYYFNKTFKKYFGLTPHQYKMRKS